MDPLASEDPRQLGPFKLIARLGSGGMGVVFLGSKGSQRVAVKVMRSSFLDSPNLKTRFQREIDTLKKLKSPYVARYLDSDIEGELAWHAVEFVNGPTLKERIEHDGPMNAEDWAQFYDQLRQALSDIHSAGVVHRDLKPSNLILSESGLKIIDFGISHDSDATSLTTTGMVAGSPAWLSPEQLEGTEIGPGSDLFSAGSILVFAALGRSPWGNETTMSVPVAYQKILSRDFQLEGLSEPARDAVTALCEEHPMNRRFVDSQGGAPKLPASGQSFSHELLSEKAIAGVDSTAVRNRVKRLQGGIGAILIAAIGVGVFALLPRQIEPSPDSDGAAVSQRSEQMSVGRVPADLLESRDVVAIAERNRTSRLFKLLISVESSQIGDNTTPWVQVVALDSLGEVERIIPLGSCGSGPLRLTDAQTSLEGHVAWSAICSNTIGPSAWGAGSPNWVQVSWESRTALYRLEYSLDRCNPFLDQNC